LCKEGEMCGQGGQNSTQKGHTRHTKKVASYMGILKRNVNVEKNARAS
jgi:hypothetical protein